MKLIKKLLASSLLLASTAALANSALYEVEVTGLQGLSIMKGSTVWQPKPLYPSLALRRGLEGEVLVEYSIDSTGKAVDIKILEASPRGFFDNSTVRALQNATFGVAYNGGEAIPVQGVKKRFIYQIERGQDNSLYPRITAN